MSDATTNYDACELLATLVINKSKRMRFAGVAARGLLVDDLRLPARHHPPVLLGDGGVVLPAEPLLLGFFEALQRGLFFAGWLLAIHDLAVSAGYKLAIGRGRLDGALRRGAAHLTYARNSPPGTQKFADGEARGGWGPPEGPNSAANRPVDGAQSRAGLARRVSDIATYAQVR